jgi:hypothetical protein
MPSIIFPSTIPKPQYPFKESTFDPMNRTSFDSGDVASRPKFTRARKKFELKWDFLDDKEYADVEAFFTSLRGASFTWNHPITGKDYILIWSDDSLDVTVTMLNRYAVTVRLEEV